MAEKYKAVLKNLRISPQKVRLVVDLVRGKPVQTALDILKLTNKGSSGALSKLLRSSISNATNRATVDVDRLVVSEVFVDGGSALKRWTPRAQGRATPIKKRYSHVTMVVSEL